MCVVPCGTPIQWIFIHIRLSPLELDLLCHLPQQFISNYRYNYRSVWAKQRVAQKTAQAECTEASIIWISCGHATIHRSLEPLRQTNHWKSFEWWMEFIVYSSCTFFLLSISSSYFVGFSFVTCFFDFFPSHCSNSFLLVAILTNVSIQHVHTSIARNDFDDWLFVPTNFPQ